MGRGRKTEGTAPLRRVATAMVAVAVMIGGIGVTESAALWRRLGSNELDTDMNEVQVCRDGVVVDVVIKVNRQSGPVAAPLGRSIRIANEYSPIGSAPETALVAERDLDGADLEFQYLTAARLPQDYRETDPRYSFDDDTTIQYYYGRFVVPFSQFQDEGTPLYLDVVDQSAVLPDEEQLPSGMLGEISSERIAAVEDCRIWPAAFSSFVAQLFNRLFRAFGWGNQGITSIPTLAG